MLRIDARQAGKLRKNAVGEWLRASFTDSPQSAVLDSTGDVLVSDPAGNAIRFAFDKHGFVGVIQSPLGRTWRFTNDQAGRPLGLQTPSGTTIRSEYDPAGQLVSVSRDAVPQYALAYGANGLLRQISYPDHTSIGFNYSPSGHLIATRNRLDESESYQRDADDELVSLLDGNGNRTTFEYGEWNRPDRTLFADGSSESYEYDDSGYVSRLSSSDGTVLQILNAPDGHPLSIKADDTGLTEFQRDAEGRITSAKADGFTILYRYDEAGRIISEAQGTHTIEYRYDNAGTLAGIRYPNGEWVEFGYDPDLRLSHLRDWSGQSHSISYAQHDQGYQVRLTSGLVTAVRQTKTGLPSSFTILRDGRIRRAVFSLEYRYDGEDRVTHFTDSEFGAREYQYDAEGRLLGVNAPARENTERFAYDAAGNRTVHNTTRSTYDNLNRLVRNGDTLLRYDERGNLLDRAGWSFTYDSRNRLVRAERAGGESVMFGYDAFGRRTWKRTGSSETRYVWAGEQLVHETTTNGGTVASQDYLYLPGTYTPFATRINGSIYFYHTDHLGTPRRLSDAAGQIVWAADYDAYGRARIAAASIANPLRYPGQYHDDETGLHYNRFRFYAPELGRYISQDPISFLAGLNFYTYCDNDPINSADPLGLINWKAIGSVVAAVAVGAAVVALAPVITPLAIIAAGAAAGAVGAGLYEGLENGFCAKCIAAATGKGALVGAFASIPLAFLPATAGIAAFAGAGALGGGAGYVADWAVNYPRIRWNWGDLAFSAGLGAATGGAARYLGPRIARWRTTSGGRLPQDVAVNPTPPPAKPLRRPIGKSAAQNRQLQADIAAAKAQGATDFRVNQQQVNAQGRRVGTNRPDLQYTDVNGKRVYIEYDRPTSNRGPAHKARLEANDPGSQVILKKIP